MIDGTQEYESLLQQRHSKVLIRELGDAPDGKLTKLVFRGNVLSKGSLSAPKWMNFWKISEQPLTPRPFIGKNVAIFSEILDDQH